MLDTRELLSHLSKLENGLESFSFAELKSDEATKLKKSFESFKNGLEAKVFGSNEVIMADLAPEMNTPVMKKTEEHTVISNVSHEIRTPLTGIVGFIDLLKETKLTQRQWQLVNALGGASQNLMDVVNELLEFSKLAAGREKFVKVAFKPKNLIGEVGFLCRTLITNKEIDLNIEIDENVPTILKGDPSKLSQILLNLLGNAIKFVEKGKIDVQIRVKSNQKENVFVEFVIADTGIGIANDKLKQIFEAHQQAEPDTHLKYGGSGLGLSIVKELIEKLGGCISVNSILGSGTTFKVILPFENGVYSLQTNDDTNYDHSSDSVKKESFSGTKILVFEDNTLNQKLMENRLKTWGCDTFITDNGIYGLKLLENHDFDMVLMDLRMPGMDGFEIASRMRQSSNPKIKKLPIVAISADFSETDQEKCEAFQITDLILKPYNANELHEIIRRNTTKMIVAKNTTTLIPEEQTDDMVLVNLNPILEQCLGQTELLDELVRLFKQNIFEFIGKVKIHLQSGNVQGIGFAAHKIKSSLKMLEANSLSQICEQIALGCKANPNQNTLNNLYQQFLEEYPKVEARIDAQMNSLKTK